MSGKKIFYKGIKTHNLKNISLEIPQSKLITITGVSGSGKSSLAFDTIYAEGNRRYIETLSTYVRQFLEKIDPPPIEDAQNILPAVALKQHNPNLNNRSTVGIITEILPLLRELYAHFSQLYCPECKIPVKKYTTEEIISFIKQNEKTYLLLTLTSPQQLEKELKMFLSFGFYRLFDLEKEKIIPIEIAIENNDFYQNKRIYILVDRFKNSSNYQKIKESLHLALKFQGKKILLFTYPLKRITTFHLKNICPQCQKEYPDPTPQLFSFNSPLGACPKCEGFGKIPVYDEKSLIPNPHLSISQGAIHIFTFPSLKKATSYFIDKFRELGVRTECPVNQLSSSEKEIILYGKGEFKGLSELIEAMEKKKYKKHIRIMLSRLRTYQKCPECQGNRLNKTALSYKISGKNLADLEKMEIEELIKFIKKNVNLNTQLSKEIIKRLNYLIELGLPYLTLGRPSRTLSGGEFQRIRLASILGTGLYNTMYVLDEPTIGLHSRDTKNLLKILQEMTGKKNTIIVVEHDWDFIKESDYIIELGPQGGEKGGKIVFSGQAKDYKFSQEGINSREKIIKFESFFQLNNIQYHNLKNINIKFPKNSLSVITGVSGAGKSSLLEYLFQNFTQLETLLIDQQPIGKTSRSIPATYLDFFDDIREIFSNTREAKYLGWKKGDFSFNSGQGRCPECQGSGVQKVELLFLPDALLKCEKCNGKRYKSELLKITFKGKNIAHVLEMTISEAINFFADYPKLIEKMKWAKLLGIDYLKLGQPSPTLSGGESQRLKIAKYLKNYKNKNLILLDEPTTGLHYQDIKKLIKALDKLIKLGATIICIEHNPYFIYNCDYVIDLGPEGGKNGGEVLFQGKIEQFLLQNTYTSLALQEFLEKYG